MKKKIDTLTNRDSGIIRKNYCTANVNTISIIRKNEETVIADVKEVQDASQHASSRLHFKTIQRDFLKLAAALLKCSSVKGVPPGLSPVAE